MPSTLACIGMDAPTLDEFETLFARNIAPNAVVLFADGDHHTFCWTDVSGAQIIVVGKDGQASDWYPTYESTTSSQVAGLRPIREDLVMLDIVDDEGETLTRLSAQCDAQQTLAEEGASGTVSISALAIAMEVFATVEDYLAAPGSYLHSRLPEPDEEPLQLAENGFIPLGLFFSSAEEATPEARLHGTVLAAERKTNLLTGQEFVVARVESAGFEADVCFAGDNIDGVPAVGSIVAGRAYMTVSFDADSVDV